MSLDPRAGPTHSGEKTGVESPTQPLDMQPPQSRPTEVASWEVSGFLHPSSVLFEVVSHIRQYIVPAIFGVIGAAQGSFWWTGIATVVFASALAHTLIRYFTLRYGIHGDDFIVTEGFFFRRVRSVPLRRIQNMDLVQNVLHRVFGVAEVNVETASGNKPEATLRVLTGRQIEQLRQAIFGGDNSGSSDTASENRRDTGASTDVFQDTVFQDTVFQDAVFQGTASSAAGTAVSQRTGQTLYEIPVRDLVLAGLASNRGLILLGIAIGFFFQFDLEDRLDMDLIGDRIRQQGDAWHIAAYALLGFIVLMFLLRLLGIAWYILRFHGYRLSRLGDDLRISCGLLTRVSATIPRKRIQFISVHRPLMMRPLGLASIRIETAGGAGKDNENAATTVSRRWFLPVVSNAEIKRILAELRPDLIWDIQAVSWHGVSPLAARRLLRAAILAAGMISLVGLAATRPWGWLAGPISFPLMLVLAIKKSRSKRYARTAWGIAFQSGVFTRKLSFSFYDRIQGLRLSQTPFDRRWQMATLSVDTAAAGPAEHSIEVAYLDEDFAKSQFRDLQTAAAHHRPSWA